MATFLELMTEVRGNIIDLPTFVTNNVPAYVNRAIRELQNKHNFKVMEADSGVLVTAPDTRVLSAVPANFKEYRGTPYVINVQGDTRELIVGISRETAEHDVTTDAGGEADPEMVIGPPRIILQSEMTEQGASNWEVWPLSDALSLYANGEYRIRVPYWKYLAELSGSTDTNWFTVNGPEWIIRTATAMGFAADHNLDSSAYWTQLAAAKYQEVVNLDKRYRLSGVQNLVPHGDVWGNKHVNTRAFWSR